MEPLSKTGGRNNYGRITSRIAAADTNGNTGVIDFKREKTDIPARVARIEYDPNRSTRIALLHYADGEKRYILAPQDLKVGDLVVSSAHADIKPGNALPIANIPLGTTIHNIELKPGCGGTIGPQCRHLRPAHGQGRTNTVRSKCPPEKCARSS